ncbi:glycosyl transferase family 2 [Plantactinospora sp. BC1]|nr:glycosyl transferase family 2 [Plantactinospora sp. BC1]
MRGAIAKGCVIVSGELPPPAADPPGISVVVPVRGRVAELADLLESLAVAAARCPAPVEVVVVDDSCAEDAARHRANCERAGARYVTGPRHVGAKRNLGVALARHDLVLFTDSDCQLAPDVLQRHVSRLHSAPRHVAGVAGPTRVRDSDTAVFRVARRSPYLNTAFDRPIRYTRVTWATTSNLALRKSAFQQVGGFAEDTLTVVAGEDVDLGLRLSAAGYVIECDPKAEVIHHPGNSESLRAVCQRLYTYGRSGQWLSQVHPGRRRAKTNAVSAVGVAAAAGVAAARVTRGRSLLAAPLVAAALLARDAYRRYRPGDGPHPVRDAVACALLDWSNDAGKAVAAIQLGRPDYLFGEFEWVDEPTRRAATNADPSSPDGPADGQPR